MTSMAELPTNSEPESVSAAAEDESGLVEVFETTLDISQDAEPIECAAPEKMDNNDTLRQEDGQRVGQEEGQTKEHSSPADESCSSSQSESKWVVGAPCRAVWSEDGRQYLAKIVSLDKEHCRVRFDGYGNEEDVEISALKSADADLQNSQDWRTGSRCRAVYSEDGLVYPAVVLWVKGQRCRVRFDEYNNEEELDIGSLLSVDELHGLGRAPKGISWKSSTDWRRKRREESQGERGGGDRRPGRRDEQQNSWVKDKQSNQSNGEKETEEKKSETKKSTNHSFPFFPPFPPPQLSSAEPVFIPPPPPPPPPLWAVDGKESGTISAASSMLMLWYMCGFHTGSYLAQQEFKSNSKH